MTQFFLKILSEMRWHDFLDIFLAAVLIYYFLVWLQGTRAMQLLRGFFVFFIIYFVSRLCDLKTIDWLFAQFSTIFIFLIVIVFQPELRKALERIGQARFLKYLLPFHRSLDLSFIRKISDAVEIISQNKWGAIIVIERTASLREYWESGLKLEANLNPDLLVAIFNPQSPLHDGAVIIQNNLILAARCFLPLTENPGVDKSLGSRHRAVIGISEQTDAVAISISEQSSNISIADGGRLQQNLTKENFEEKLWQFFAPTKKKKS